MMAGRWQTRINGPLPLVRSRATRAQRWDTDFAAALRKSMDGWERTGGHVRVRIIVRFRPGNGVSDIDVDNCAKVILDLLQTPGENVQGILHDDGAVQDLCITKRHILGDPYVKIRLDWSGE